MPRKVFDVDEADHELDVTEFVDVVQHVRRFVAQIKRNS